VGKFVKGDVVVVPFPFTDLTQAKKRPAFVVTALEGNDLILCQITSRDIKDNYAVQLENSDFENGGLKQISNIRPNRIFTADSRIILYKAGALTAAKTSKVVDKIIGIIRN
jgi:mRNA interferase MazF